MSGYRNLQINKILQDCHSPRKHGELGSKNEYNLICQSYQEKICVFYIQCEMCPVHILLIYCKKILLIFVW